VGTASAGRTVSFNPFAALVAPAHTEITNERLHFDPVPVFIGPAPGWKGPALGARPTRAASAAGDNTATASAPDAEAGAAPPQHGVRKIRAKPVRHATADVKPGAKLPKDNREQNDKDKKDVSTD
jgi:hypothetical protein